MPLSDFVIADIKRIAERETVATSQWQPYPAPEQAIVETPVYRKELGLWPHQKFFVLLGANKMSGFVAHKLSGFRVPEEGRNETGRMATGDSEDEI